MELDINQATEKPLWSPSNKDLNDSVMARFSAWLEAKQDTHFDGYAALHHFSVTQPEIFWDSLWDYFGLIGERGSQKVQDLKRLPGAVWFPDSKINFAENLLRYAKDTPNQIACTESNEHGIIQSITYSELANKVATLATELRKLGVKESDRVAAISTNSHHAIVGMLATASIGAVWSSCSPDFGVSGILDRFEQIRPTVLLACNRYQYAGKVIDCVEKVTLVAEALDSLQAIICFNPLATEADAADQCDGDVDTINTNVPIFRWNRIVNSQSIPPLQFTRVAFNAPLYILFSSGTTGKPKCIVHGVGGTLLQHVKELALHTDVTSGTRLFYFTTCGWMMWNWYVSGLALGASLVLYDGSPFHPKQSVLFDLADDAQIEVFGASAKYFSAAEKFGLKPRQSHNLTSLKSILSTGSPLVPESFDYLYRDVSHDVRVSSISGGTDIVSCFALGSPTLPVWRGELQCAGLGMDIDFVDEQGVSLDQGKGELICRTAFPSMPVCFWKDTDGSRYFDAYFARHNNSWAHGDFGELCQHKLNDGSHQRGVMIHGRADAVLNPNGVRIGTAEIYRQVEKVDAVFESLAIGQKWHGDERIILFVKLQHGQVLDEALKNDIKQIIRTNTSPRHVPAKIVSVPDIPRTRSGKIVELAVRSIVHGEEVKNTEALANPDALDYFRDLVDLKD
ncbi:acetoacetate--CoA ligase [Oleiphilus sp. HI0079]|uniref:acetoacetate--CoA ligase n=1 Tax=Oleiphilus sp. HI0079 TaxID=1822254 RepID=UPI000A9B969A|nr:acetoacetate--CoA ligase [Oleiphilus sp. HI0079]